MTVPALWAGRTMAGEDTGGIEPAVIKVSSGGSGDFDINLDGIEAAGTGPAWTAASASAAAIGTLYSGTDPSVIHIDFTVTGPIDGPSAGAILTVGVLAAIKGQALDPTVTMTGTIAPDGSVGSVSGIEAKLTAAHEAGFKTVLVPAVNLAESKRAGAGGGGGGPDLADYGANLGLTVTGVNDAGEAYRAFTHTAVVDDEAPAAQLQAAAASVAQKSAEALIARLNTALNNGTSLPGRDELAAETRKAQQAADSGNVALAYGLAADAYRQLVRAQASEAFAADKEALPAIVGGLKQEADRIAEAAAMAAASAAAAGTQGISQQVSLPSALAWPVSIEAVSQATSASLDQADSRAKARAAARILAQQRADLEVFFPDALAVVRAVAADPGQDPKQTAGFISGYTNFLVRAAQANETYSQAVLGTDSALRGIDPGNLAAATSLLLERAAEIPADAQSLADETMQSALAMTCFVMSSMVLAEAQNFSLSGSGIGADPDFIGNPAALANSVTTGASWVEAESAAAAAEGLDPSFPLWSSRWAVALAADLSGTPREAAAAVMALDEIWYDSITVAMLDAAWNPQPG